MCPSKCLYLSKLLMASTKTEPKSREPRVEAAESFNNLYFTRCKHNDNMNRHNVALDVMITWRGPGRGTGANQVMSSGHTEFSFVF